MFEYPTASSIAGLIAGLFVEQMDIPADQSRSRREDRRDECAILEERVATLRAKQPDDKAYQKVFDLASRGLTLRHLLDFYRKLLNNECPLNFDPAQTSTNNVVWDAIVPMTQDQGCSMSEVLQEGKPIFPKRMVTHNGSNKFTHLVAACVADTLTAGTYTGVVSKLSTVSKLDALVDELTEHDLDATLWICAFAVNQV